MIVTRADRKRWYSGPLFAYHCNPAPTGSRELYVNVAHSSWPLRGVRLCTPVTKALKVRLRKQATARVLDFGAGAWLRYSEHVCKRMPAWELHVVEYSDAFRDDAAAVRDAMRSHATIQEPGEFALSIERNFDLILLVNVLNTVPEVDHREAIFRLLVKHLSPLGWLVVYQRIWVGTENPVGAIPYSDGWLIPPRGTGPSTFRGSIGAQWFNKEASRAKLQPLDLGIAMSSSNNVFKIWEKKW